MAPCTCSPNSCRAATTGCAAPGKAALKCAMTTANKLRYCFVDAPPAPEAHAIATVARCSKKTAHAQVDLLRCGEVRGEVRIYVRSQAASRRRAPTGLRAYGPTGLRAYTGLGPTGGGGCLQGQEGQRYMFEKPCRYCTPGWHRHARTLESVGEPKMPVAGPERPVRRRSRQALNSQNKIKSHGTLLVLVAMP